MKIQPYIHRCVVQEGPAAGNKVRREVDAYDIEYATECEHCGEVLATPEQAIAHVYSQLTEDE